MNNIYRVSLVALATAGVVSGARAQSDSFCSNAADSSRVIGTGPVRMVALARPEFKLCVTARGFTDSAEVHPREWPNHAAAVTFETLRAGDVRRLESSAQRTLMTINGQARVVDSAVASWREQVYAVVEARWNVVSLRQQRAELENAIVATRRNHAAMTAEIDTLQRQSAAINARIRELQAAEQAAKNALTREERVLADLHAQISRERNAMASLQGTTPDAAARLRAAEQRVRQLELMERRQESLVRAYERRLMDIDASRRTGQLALTLRELDPETRITVLRLQLAELDADARIESLRAQVASLHAERRLEAMETQLEQAIAKLSATLRR